MADTSLADELAWNEVDKFVGALKAIGAGAVVIVSDDDARVAWRKTFKDMEHAGFLAFHPLIRVSDEVPEGQIRIQDVDDRPDEVDEAVAQPGMSKGGVILPHG